MVPLDKDAERRRKVLLAAIDVATGSQVKLAREAGVSEGSFRFYRMGIRHPGKRTLRLVLKVLEKHQKRLTRAIEKLRRVAD